MSTDDPATEDEATLALLVALRDLGPRVATDFVSAHVERAMRLGLVTWLDGRAITLTSAGLDAANKL